MHLFYAPEINGASYQLNEEESKHCTRVLRLAVGDTLYLTDGRGTLFTAQMEDNHPKRCVVKVIHADAAYQPRPYYLHLAVALTKNMERYEWMLEKVTEIGVDEITPLLCDHSERRIWKRERAEKILISAMKQSLKTRLPKLNEPCEFLPFMQEDFDGKKWIAHCAEGNRLALKEAVAKTPRLLIAVGPEGDFSAKEIERSGLAGYEAIALGESRLRTETAGLVACTAAYIAWSNGK